MKRRTHLPLLFFVKASIFAICSLIVVFVLPSCADNNDESVIIKDNISSVELIGQLKHVTYWDDHDQWDINSLLVNIIYDDGTTMEISTNSKCLSFEFIPESPKPGTTSFSVVNSFVISENGQKFSIPVKTYGVVVQKYPYANTSGEYISIIVSVLLVAISFVVFGIVGYTNRNKKNEKDNSTF